MNEQIQLAVPNVKIAWTKASSMTSAYAAELAVTYPQQAAGTYRFVIDRVSPGKWALRVWKDGSYWTGCPGKTLKALKVTAENIVRSAMRGVL